MSKQNYENHIKSYPLHHFIFYPLLIILFSISLYKHFTVDRDNILWLFIATSFLFIGWLSFMTRQHYALTLQNRLVRQEMRHKYFVLSGKDFELLEQKLSFGQIAALRFASDEELIPLIERTLKENLKPDTIKRSIMNWKADELRV